MSTRENDLSDMHKVFSNPAVSMSERKQAYWAYGQIQKQEKDKYLQGLRERLIKALRVRDHQEIRKFNELINEHKHRMKYGR